MAFSIRSILDLDRVDSAMDNTLNEGTKVVMAEIPNLQFPRIRELGLSRNKIEKMSFIHSALFHYMVIALYSILVN